MNGNQHYGTSVCERADVNCVADQNNLLQTSQRRRRKGELHRQVLENLQDGDTTTDLSNRLPGRPKKNDLTPVLRQLLAAGYVRRSGSRAQYQWWHADSSTAPTPAIQPAALARTAQQEVKALQLEITSTLHALQEQVGALEDLFQRVKRIGEHANALEQRYKPKE